MQKIEKTQEKQKPEVKVETKPETKKLVFNQKFYDLDLCGETIQYRKWTAKDEKNFLKLFTSKSIDAISEEDIFSTLIKPIVKNKSEKSDKSMIFTPNEQKLILLKSKISSYSNIADIETTCEFCNSELEITIDLDKSTEFKCSSFKEIEILIDNETEKIIDKTEDLESDKISSLKITFSKKNIEKFRKFVNSSDIIDNIFTSFMTFIEKIEYNGIELEIKNENDFNELDSFLDSLPDNIFNTILDEFSKVSDDFRIAYSFECPSCKKYQEQEVQNIFDLKFKTK